MRQIDTQSEEVREKEIWNENSSIIKQSSGFSRTALSRAAVTDLTFITHTHKHTHTHTHRHILTYFSTSRTVRVGVVYPQ